jgi:hypothetical protein
VGTTDFFCPKIPPITKQVNKAPLSAFRQSDAAMLLHLAEFE